MERPDQHARGPIRLGIGTGVAHAACADRATHEAGVLIADLSLRTAVTFALEAQGIRVDVYENLATFGIDRDPGCVIIDLAPHEADAAGWIAELRRYRGHAPVIVLACCPSRRTHEAVAAVGATLVEKPLLTDVLCATVGRVTQAGRGC